MRKWRLFHQLFLSYLWLAVAAVGLVALHGSHLMRQSYLAQTEADLEARARLCAHQILSRLDAGTAAVDALCKELGNAKGVQTRFTVILPDGRVIGDTAENPTHMDNHKDRPEVQQAAAAASGVGCSTRYSNTLKEDRMYVAVAVRQGALPGTVVRASLPATAINKTVAVMRRRTVLACLAASALIAAVSLWVSRRISQPLEQMKTAAVQFARGDLQHRLPDSGSLEISALSDAMTQMAEQLDDRIRTISRQRSEQEAMFVSMDEGVLAVDQKGRIINLNKACANLLDAVVADLKGRNLRDVVRAADLLEFVEAALASGGPADRTIQLHGENESELRAHATVLHDACRQKMGVLIVFHDMTRLRQLETVRRDFVANVSHELGTPITAIKAAVESLLDEHAEDQQTTRQFLEIILRQVNRLDAMADDLLALARLEAESEQLQMELRRCLLRDVVQAAVGTCAAVASDRDIRLEWQCSEALAADIDARLLEQAIVNLVDNAVKYSERGTVVRVTAAAEERGLAIAVRDEGCGIAAKHLSRIFERFYRVDKARSRALGGTGLGLAIVKRIALLHGGSVDVRSTVGQGSTFSIHLPAFQPATGRAD